MRHGWLCAVVSAGCCSCLLRCIGAATWLEFDIAAAAMVRVSAISRKTNRDPEKVEWQLSEADRIVGDQEPFVAPVDLGHEDFVHDWSLTPHAAV